MECLANNHIKFDFLGKDSIRYENEVAVEPRVWQLVKQFCRGDKKAGARRAGLTCADMLPVTVICTPLEPWVSSSQHSRAWWCLIVAVRCALLVLERRTCMGLSAGSVWVLDCHLSISLYSQSVAAFQHPWHLPMVTH